MVGLGGWPVGWVLLAAGLFTLFSFLRFSCNIGVIERPLVQGLVWGVVTGDVTFAVSVSLVFELFWLDLIPAGTFIPPNAAASNLIVLAVAEIYGFREPAQIIFPVLLSLPLAWVASRGEQMLRRRQDQGYDTLQLWLRPGSDDEYRPQDLVRRAALMSAAGYLVFMLAAASLMVAGVGWLLGQGLLRPPMHMFSWPHLWITASLGGLLALRVPGAYGILTCGACAVAVLGLFFG